MKKLVGEVTFQEKEEIQALFERKNALAELAKIITADNDALYEKLVKDIGTTGRKFQQWWDDKALAYNWEKTPAGRWKIDFDTNEIFLIE